jgi:Co/Zn/Cd efflux system component
MIDRCHDHCCTDVHTSAVPAWRRAPWIALAVNAGMFATEIGVGLAADSSSLQADSLDFLGDPANCAISLGVTGLALSWRARAALLKGITLFALGAWVAVTTTLHAYHGELPRAEFMGAVGLLALVTNGGVALTLYRFRSGEANMRSVWICSRNDAFGNIAVLLAAIGVFGSGTVWPDVIVALIMTSLSLSGGFQILRHAIAELRGDEQLPSQTSGTVS